MMQKRLVRQLLDQLGSLKLANNQLKEKRTDVVFDQRRGTRVPIRIELCGDTSKQEPHLGIYELEVRDGLPFVVNKRPAYKHLGKDIYLFYTNNDSWFIGSKSKMEEGGDVGVMHVVDKAMFPHKINRVWKEWGGAAWSENDSIIVRVLDAAAYERYRQEQIRRREELLAAAPATIELIGEAQYKYGYLGRYNLCPEYFINDHPVYKHDRQSAYMFHTNTQMWFVGKKLNMEQGADFGFLYSRDKALYPHEIQV